MHQPGVDHQYILEANKLAATYIDTCVAKRNGANAMASIIDGVNYTNCRSIEEHPKVGERQVRLGDWEADTLLGKNHKPVLLSLTKCKSHFTLLGQVPQRTAQTVRKQTVRLLLPISDKVHTLTSDHGKEFAAHQQIAQALGLQFYFAHPYAAWKRGTNENTNGLVRHYFPKKHDFQLVSNKQIEQATAGLNF